MNFVNHNGRVLPREECRLPVENRAFRFGYGVFETMLVKDGQIWLGDLHWQRLFAAMDALLIPKPALWNAALLTEEVVQLAKKNGCKEACRARLQVYAGSGGLFDVGPADTAAYLAECFPIPPHMLEANSNGLVLGIAADFPKAISAASTFKTCGALHYAVAARIAKREGWNDALIVNPEGRVIESCTANIFWMKDGHVFTPPLSEGCIAGVERRFLLEHLPERGISVSEQALPVETLREADEVYLTNAVLGARWVGRIGERTYTGKMLAQFPRRL